APGRYIAVIDIIAGAGFLPNIAVGGPRAGGLAARSGVVCGGRLATEEVVVLLDVGTIAWGPSPPLKMSDPEPGYPLVNLPHTAGGMLQQPDPIHFKLPPGVLTSPVYDVKTVLRNPDPANIPPSGWMIATPSSHTLPVDILAVLDPVAVGTLPPCDYD